jgi:NAD(P)-dependent dehydrogenase (short-subunit alcohol dehydrogenase family)
VGTFRCIAKSAAGMMTLEPMADGERGAMVNTASVAAEDGQIGQAAYSASKGGIAQLTKSLAGAWAAENIRVNAIAPGWIETDLTRPLQEDPASSGAILARTPAARWGKPDDVAGVIAFLATPEARFVTGAVLPVDGGYLAM